MNEFNRSKITGIRWLKKPVEDVQIKIKLKQQNGIVSLPKFEDYTTESSRLSGISVEQLEQINKECVFKWQEKVFSSWELQRYADVHNCITEVELNYNEMIRDLDFEPSKIFTYIHEDYHKPLPNMDTLIETKPDVVDLQSCFEKLGINDKLGKMMCVMGDTSSSGHLFRSTENIATEAEQWTAMHVVFDNSEYNEDSQLLLKQEATLVSLYYNKSQNYLMISPEVNNLDLNPYTVETETGVSLEYQYSVDIQFEEEDSSDELVMLLRKLLKKWERRQRQVINFEMPPLGKKLYFISLEILTATAFDMDNLYVEFNIKVPEGIQCHDTLHGRTHVTKSVRLEDVEVWNYSHIIEINLEMAAGSDPPPIKIFFEVISTDWWGRHRTEGYTYLPLTLSPGNYSKQLSCSRPEEKDSTEAESRRFFIGGCNLIKDLEVLTKPNVNANFKFVTTGKLSLRWHILSQAPLPGSLPKPESHGATSASAVLLGAEAVLRQYRKARARLAIATEGLGKGEPVA